MVMGALSLLFCKSGVFLHPTKNSRDNQAGFLLLTIENRQPQQDALLSWLPESGLSSAQVAWLKSAEIEYATTVNMKRPMDPDILAKGSRSSWYFSVKLGGLYLVQLRLPSPSGYWYGSVVLHSKYSQQEDMLPILFFHDDVCPSTIAKQKELNKSFDPFTSSGDAYWGGIDLRHAMQKLVDLQRTDADPTVWLVNASLDDLRNFAPRNATKQENTPEIPEVGASIWDKWENTKWGIMSHVAEATTKTGTLIGKLLRKHPLVQLAEKNSDNPYVRKLLENPRVQEIQDEFDSARIYLAKWALGVKQEADKYQINNGLNEVYKNVLARELGLSSDSDVYFTQEELSKAIHRNFPLSQQKWDSFFDSQGRLCITVNEVKDYIFHGGVQSMELRKKIWPFLLGVYPWDSSLDERRQLDEALREAFNNNYKAKIEEEIVPEEHDDHEYWKDQIFRIEKDVKRNDRNIDIYKFNTADGKEPTNLQEEEEPSSISDTLPSSDEHWTIKNPHLKSLRSILICYNLHNPNLGYVQGMADLLSPIYYVLQDEALVFWCFVNFMERMERNFLRDQSGIRDQMITLNELCQLMLPKLSEHLQKCDSSNLFFCFRMLLVWFKREFEFQDVCSIWEIFFTDYYSSQFQLFFMLAILQKSSDAVIQNLNQFDQVLKYFNDLHGNMEWNDLMTRSELLFIKFQRIVDILSRAEASRLPTSEESHTSGMEIYELTQDDQRPNEANTQVSEYLERLLSKKLIIQKEEPRNRDSIK